MSNQYAHVYMHTISTHAHIHTHTHTHTHRGHRLTEIYTITQNDGTDLFEHVLRVVQGEVEAFGEEESLCVAGGVQEVLKRLLHTWLTAVWNSCFH